MTTDLDESAIAALVHTFYRRARAHPELGPLFERYVADWDAHEAVIRDFWSHALLRTGRYRGHPFTAHVNRSLRPAHFEQWLDLFREVACETLPPSYAVLALRHAQFMADSFRAGLFPFEPSRSIAPKA